ncbi:MAG: tetratricopeptide repeat protein [Legionellales bacterium]|nr:tetratricopeptide repeat protein [Legionellales bacterium]
MEKNKFTQTEIKVLACFTLDNIKPSLIAKILNKSIRTIYAHLNKIKSKAEVQTIDDIALFVRKSADFKELQGLFKNQYIDYFYRKTAKKIAYKLKEFNIVCNIIVSHQLSNTSAIAEIISLIQLAGINVNIITQTEISNNLAEKDINLCVILDASEIKKLELELKQNHAFIILNEKEKNILINDSKIIVYNPENKRDFYKYFVNYLIREYQTTIDSDEIINFTSDIDNIANNIQEKNMTYSENYIANASGSSVYSSRIITLVIVGFILSGVSYYYLNKVRQSSLSHVVKNNVNFIQSYEQWSWNLPRRNKKFTGREELFKNIKVSLDKYRIDIITQSIVGAGGIGKTQLATEYAYRAIEDKKYDIVLWINSETENSINKSYSIFANKLKINDYGLQPEQLRRVVHNKLLNKNSTKKILFVFDNVPKKEDIQTYLTEIHNHLNVATNPHILVTSRSQHWIEDSIILDIFTEQEAQAYIAKHLIHESKTNINKLAKTLYYFPLALGQAIGYIKEHTNIEDYLKMYAIEQQPYLDIKPQDTNQYKGTLWKTFSISLEKLSNYAKEILYISSYLDPDNIQLDLFNYLSLKNKSQAIQELRKHSFIILNNDKSFKIHRLLQHVIRLDVHNKKTWLNKTVEIATGAAIKFDNKNIKTWDDARNWLYHIPILTKYMPENLNKADLLHKYGKIADIFGRYALAKSFYLTSLTIKNTHYKNHENIQLTDNLINLGWMEHYLGNHKEAKKILLRSLKIRESYYQNPDHFELAEILNKLGWIEYYLGNYHESQNLLQKSLKIKESYYQDPMHAELAEVLKNLGWVKRHFGEYLEAKKLLHRSLEIKEFHYKEPMNIKFGNVFHCLGGIEYSIGNYEKAKYWLQKALVIRERHYKDPMNIRLAPTLYFLGLVEHALGKNEEAKKLLKRTVQIDDAYMKNPNNISIAINLNSLGRVEYSLGNYNEAKKLLHRSLKIKEFCFQDPLHVKLANTLQNLSLIAEELGNYSDALKYSKKAYMIWNKFYQPRLHEVMGHIYTFPKNWPKLNNKNPSRALNYYEERLAITKKLFGEKHHFVAGYYDVLGQIYEIHEQPETAIKKFNLALNIAKEFEKTIKNDAKQIEFRKNISLVQNRVKKINQKANL